MKFEDVKVDQTYTTNGKYKRGGVSIPSGTTVTVASKRNNKVWIDYGGAIVYIEPGKLS